jgi:hypothetical protein
LHGEVDFQDGADFQNNARADLPFEARSLDLDGIGPGIERCNTELSSVIRLHASFNLRPLVDHGDSDVWCHCPIGIGDVADDRRRCLSAGVFGMVEAGNHRNAQADAEAAWTGSHNFLLFCALDQTNLKSFDRGEKNP